MYNQSLLLSAYLADSNLDSIDMAFWRKLE